MSGSFWKFSNGFTSLSNISTLLENHSINIESGDPQSNNFNVLMKLLDENDLLQELLSNNSLLLEFLREEEVLSILVDLVIHEGASQDEIIKKFNDLNINDKDDEKNDNDNTSKTNDDANDDDSKTDEKNDSSSTDKIDTNEENSSKSNSDKSDDTDDENEPEDDDDDEDDDENETEEEKRTRYATLAAEILSADVWSLTDTVMESTENLNKLWAILDNDSPLSINLSTYFMKIMEHLLDMKCEEMITYLIDNQPCLVQKFMNNLSNPPLMDFLLKLISTDKQDNATGIIDFLQNQDLITYLINSLDITNSPDIDYDILLVRQSSAADFLKALITISANSTTDNSTIGPNELTRELVSYDQMNRLCNIMLKGGYALANGVGIIIEIIRKNNSDYDILPVLYITLESHPPTGRDPIYLGHLLKVFGDKIDDFNKLLVDFGGDEKPSLKTPFGVIEPLGFERFKICELIAELLHCSNMALLNDNKGFDVVKERDLLRDKMKEYDPISFKYNEVIILPNNEDDNTESSDNNDSTDGNNQRKSANNEDEDYANDTIDSFNSRLHQEDEAFGQPNHFSNDDEAEEPHANANLSEDQIRSKPVIGDFLKIALFDTQIISNILAMFFKFPWNNFLHNVVFDIVQQVLNGSMDIGFNKFLAIDLFNRGDITNKIIEGQTLCSEYEAKHNGLRLGFMGHLTLIAEEVVKFIQLYPVNSLSEIIDQKIEDEVWSNYVSHVLYDTREKYNAILGGEEEEESSQTFDEGSGDIIEADDLQSDLLYDPKEYHDIVETGHDDNSDSGENHDHQERIDEKDEPEDEESDLAENKTIFTKKSPMKEENDDEEIKSKKAETNKSNSSDESESDDDDHFTTYMTQQLTNTASITPSVTKVTNEDNKIINEDNKKEEPKSQFPESYDSQPFQDEFDDEYIDPNDDGLSYKKSNPLYDSDGTLKTHSDLSILDPHSVDEDDLSSSSSSSDNEDGVLLDYEEDFPREDGHKLTRAASKG